MRLCTAISLAFLPREHNDISLYDAILYYISSELICFIGLALIDNLKIEGRSFQ